MGGWAAATGRVDPTAWLLFALLYVWQLPHTFALAWLLREEYRAAGLRMPGGNDAVGRRTAFGGVVAGMVLLLASLALAPSGTAGKIFGAVALVTGMLLLAAMLTWLWQPSARTARRAFRGTLAYLPTVLFFLGISWPRGAL